MPGHNPTISVCIANYNGEKVLKDCLESIYRQEFDYNFEIIIHDDASTDDSLGLVQRQYPDVRLLKSDDNVGFCISNNRMVKEASGQFILLLNNDAALFPNALSSLLAESGKHSAGAILTLPQFDWQSGELVDRGSFLDSFYNPIPNRDAQCTDVAMVIGACLWIPRSTWTDLDGFPPWFESIAEDLWLCCKARLNGIPVRCVNGSGFRHRQGLSFGGNRPSSQKLISSHKRRRLSERNKTFTMSVMTPTLLVWPLLGLHFILLLVEGAVLSLCRSGSGFFTGIYSSAISAVVLQRTRLLRERRAVQRTRKISVFKYWRLFRLPPQKLILLLRYGLPTLKR